jgi:hypothetical protein
MASVESEPGQEGMTPTTRGDIAKVSSDEGMLPHDAASHLDRVEEGEWWRIGSRRRRAGQLRWCPDQGLVLDIHRELEPLAAAPTWAEDFSVVRGNTKQHGHVTVLGARISETRTQHQGDEDQPTAVRSVYFCDLALLNVHSGEDGPRVADVDLRLDALNRWTDRYGGVKTIPGGVKWDHSPPLVARLPFGTFLLQRHLSSSLGTSKAEVRAESGFTLRYDTPTRLATVLREGIEPAQDLVTFLLGVPCRVTNLTLWDKPNLSMFDRRQRQITVLRSGPRTAVGAISHPGVLGDAILLTQMLDRFEDVVARWFALYERLLLPLSFFMASEYAPSEFIQPSFLQSVQACEALHRRLYEGQREPQEEFEARRARILTAVSDEDRDLVSGTMRLANEYPLQQRLRQLIVTVPPALRQGWGRPGTFATLVANTRNLLAHGLRPQATRQVLDTNGMVLASWRLRRMMRVIVLGQLGFTDADILDLFRHAPPL